MEKREDLCTVSGNVNWLSHYRKQYEVTSKKLKIELSKKKKLNYHMIQLFH